MKLVQLNCLAKQIRKSWMTHLKIRIWHQIWILPPQVHAMIKMLATLKKENSTGFPPLHLTSWGNNRIKNRKIRMSNLLKWKTSLTSRFKTSFWTTGPKCCVGVTILHEIIKVRRNTIWALCCQELTIMIIRQASYKTSSKVSKVLATTNWTFASPRRVKVS